MRVALAADHAGFAKPARDGLFPCVAAHLSFFFAGTLVFFPLAPSVPLPTSISNMVAGTKPYRRKTRILGKVSMPAVVDCAKGVRLSNACRAGSRNTYSARAQAIATLAGSARAPAAQRLACGLLLVSSCTPLLFMGEEYGETAPFLYFVDHSDPDLIEAVRNGRKEEFKDFEWNGEIPDPEASGTFQHSKLGWGTIRTGNHRILLEFYKALIELRKRTPALVNQDKKSIHVQAYPGQRVLSLRRWERYERGQVFWAGNFDADVGTVAPAVPGGNWDLILDSAHTEWGGPGRLAPEQMMNGNKIALQPRSIVLYIRRDVS